MASFNIYGDCVSRDILTPLAYGGGVNVLQYVGFSNPISTTSLKTEKPITIDELENYQGSAFDKRCFFLDYNKECFNYLFRKKSDYLLIDLLNARIPVFKNERHCLTEAGFFLKNRDGLQRQFDLENHTDINPFRDILKDQWDYAIKVISDELLQHYSPDQIIVNKHFMCEKIYQAGVVKPFPSIYTEEIDYRQPHIFYNSQEAIKKTNELVCYLHDSLVDSIPGCRIIEFPQNVVADASHKWGISPLHYSPLYYEYGSNAIRVICENHSREVEKNKLFDLFERYSEKNEKDYAVSVNIKNRKLWSNNLTNCLEELCCDFLEDSRFERFIKKLHGKSVSILKVQDKMGCIFRKYADFYGANIIFTSTKHHLNTLSDEEWECCKEADVIVCCCVHGTKTHEREGIVAINIWDILRNEKVIEGMK